MIRNAETGDLDAVYALVCELENKALNYEDFCLAYREQGRDDRYSCFVYEEKGEIWAFINFRIERQLHHQKKVCEVMELCVSGKYRNRKIGTLLIDHAKQKAIEADCERIELSSSNWRKEAHRFYQEHGFELSHVNLTCDL